MTTDIFSLFKPRPKATDVYIKNKKKDKDVSEVSDIKEKDSFKEIIAAVSKHWHMYTPQNKSERESSLLYLSLLDILDRKLYPIDIKPEYVKAFIRYQGAIVGISNVNMVKSNKIYLFAFFDNKLKYEVNLKKRHYSFDEFEVERDKPIPQVFSCMYETSCISPVDESLMKKYIDLFVQDTFIQIYPYLKEKDIIQFNENGIFATINSIHNADELNKIISSILVILDNMRRLNR